MDISGKSGRYIYSGNRRAKELTDALLKFFQLGTRAAEMNVNDFWAAERGALANLDKGGVRQLSRQFGAQYIVGPAKNPLSFDEAYRNDKLVIYKIPES